MSSLPNAPPSTSNGVGLFLGTVSAAAYMVANLGLRSVAEAHVSASDIDWAIWVSTNKATPVAVSAWTLVAWRALRGLPALPPRHLLWPLIVTGLIMQWGGNVSFQYALSRGGLALTVPLSFSTILMSAAVFGRLVLGDPLSRSTVLAIGVMMAAITVLSQGTPRETSATISDGSASSTTLAVAAACVSGAAYGSGGVMIRRCVRAQLSVSATIAVLSSTGVLTLGATSLLRIGPSQLLATPPDAWLRMFASGIATAVAFFAITGAYQHLTAVKVSLLNATQIALAALAGVLLFNEPQTFWLHAGTALTIIGLVLSARRDPSPGRSPRGKRARTPAAESSTLIE
jgi:drug/metabolite transporter (DMT)-like permease